MADIGEMARELGQMLARTEEYQTLKRAVSVADEDREIQELMRRLQEVEQRVRAQLERGEKPEASLEQEYDAVLSRLQASSIYQSLVASQSNFDKVVQRVNQTIQKGLEEGGQSRIIIPG